MTKLALLVPVLALPAASFAQAPAPTLGEQVRATRPEVQKLMDDLKFQEALQRAQALLPATRPAFDKTNNQTMVTSCIRAIDLGQAYRLAVEAADAAGQWEKALDYAKEAKAIAEESYGIVKDPFTSMATHYGESRDKLQEFLKANAPRLAELKAKSDLGPLEKDELEEAERVTARVQGELQTDTKWATFFQTYLNAAKEESTAYDPLIAVMQKKLQGEADQIADYKPGKGDKAKWVEAVVSSPAYLEAQGDKAGKMRWLSRLAVLDPESKKVQRQINLLLGKSAPEPAPKHALRRKK